MDSWIYGITTQYLLRRNGLQPQHPETSMQFSSTRAPPESETPSRAPSPVVRRPSLVPICLFPFLLCHLQDQHPFTHSSPQPVTEYLPPTLCYFEQVQQVEQGVTGTRRITAVIGRRAPIWVALGPGIPTKLYKQPRAGQFITFSPAR